MEGVAVVEMNAEKKLEMVLQKYLKDIPMNDKQMILEMILKVAAEYYNDEHNLDADGIVGPLTQAAIEKALKEKDSGSSTPAPTPTPTPSANEMYRVRTSWDNAKSQVGAYRNLNYAISACKAAGGNYKVFYWC